jgi:hypothetical protein
MAATVQHERRSLQMRDWWKPYDGKFVGYVIAKNDKFIPFIARCSPDGEEDRADDCILIVQGSGPKFENLDAALKYFEDEPPGIEMQEIFTQPIKPGMMGMSWLIEPYIATHQTDPRHIAATPQM